MKKCGEKRNQYIGIRDAGAGDTRGATGTPIFLADQITLEIIHVLRNQVWGGGGF